MKRKFRKEPTTTNPVGLCLPIKSDFSKSSRNDDTYTQWILCGRFLFIAFLFSLPSFSAWSRSKTANNRPLRTVSQRATRPRFIVTTTKDLKAQLERLSAPCQSMSRKRQLDQRTRLKNVQVNPCDPAMAKGLQDSLLNICDEAYCPDLISTGSLADNTVAPTVNGSPQQEELGRVRRGKSAPTSQ